MQTLNPNKDERNEAKEWIAAQVHEYISSAYDAWRWRGGSEPSLTVALLRDCLDQTGGQPDGYRWETKRKRSALVRSVLDSEVRKGRLGVSIGLGERGRETRCYEPVSE